MNKYSKRNEKKLSVKFLRFRRLMDMNNSEMNWFANILFQHGALVQPV